jgi:serpin B
VAIALAMTYNGAENATKQAMAATLGLNGLSLQEINAANRVLISIQKQRDSEIELAIANSIWIREGIALVPEFVQRISDDYGGKIVNMDFSASDAIGYHQQVGRRQD